MVEPFRQWGQDMSLKMNGAITRSPTETEPTWAPTSSTVPMNSWPMEPTPYKRLERGNACGVSDGVLEPSPTRCSSMRPSAPTSSTWPRRQPDRLQASRHPSPDNIRPVVHGIVDSTAPWPPSAKGAVTT